MKRLVILVSLLLAAGGVFAQCGKGEGEVLHARYQVFSGDSTTAKHPAIQQADAQREKEANRKRYLLAFPAAVIGITVALIIITRRRK